MTLSANEQRRRELYARELILRYRDLRRWAVAHWPNPEQPLSASDFIAADRELQLLLGARLHSTPQPGPGRQDGAYEQVTPMPWP